MSCDDCDKWKAEAERLKTAINQYVADCYACGYASGNCGSCYWDNNGDCAIYKEDAAKWQAPMGFLAALCDRCPFQKDCREYYADKIAELKAAESKGGE